MGTGDDASTISTDVEKAEDIESRMQSSDMLSRFQANSDVDDMYSK
jgi:hypothetical protein